MTGGRGCGCGCGWGCGGIGVTVEEFLLLAGGLIVPDDEDEFEAIGWTGLGNPIGRGAVGDEELLLELEEEEPLEELEEDEIGIFGGSF